MPKKDPRKAHLFAKLIVSVEQEDQLDLARPSQIAQLIDLSIAKTVPARERFTEEVRERVLESRPGDFDEDDLLLAG